MTQCIEHWNQLGCTKAVLIYASEEGKRVYQRLGFHPGCMLAIDLPANEVGTTKPSPSLVNEFGGESYSIDHLDDDSHDLLLATNYRKLLQKADGAIPAECLLQANVVNETLLFFIQDARLRLSFASFVARNGKGQVIASVCGQVWEGPLPCIVSESVLKFGSMWGLSTDPHVPADQTSAIVSDLVHACTAHLDSIGCNKVLTLCPSKTTFELLTSVTSFHPSNTLALDIEQEREPMPFATTNTGNHVQGVTQGVIDVLRQSHPSFRFMSDLQLAWLLIANTNQLDALGINFETKTRLERVQRDFHLYHDPTDNWFTRNVSRLGKGFDLDKLSKNPQALAAKFDKLAPNYDAWTLGNHSKIESWIVKMARKHNLSKDTCVMDMCCGTGLQGLTLRLCGFEGILVGADVSAAMVDAARHRGCYDHLSVANVNEEVKYPSMVADVVICVGAMELLDTRQALATFHRLLNDNGML